MNEIPYYNTSAPQQLTASASQTVGATALAEAAALANPSVLSVRVFEYDGAIVVAALTAPVYLISERNALKAELADDISAATDMRAVVTFDMEIYRKLGRTNDTETLRGLYEKALAK